MPFHQNFNPVLFHFFGFEVRIYGLVYVFALLFLFFLLKRKEKELGIDALDLTLYTFISIIIGARLGHCFIYNAKYYLIHPLEIIEFWKGGMSFFGGLLGALLFGLFYCKRNRIDLWKIADEIIIFVPIFLFLGRIANFLNSELYGKVTDVPWCVYFKNVAGCRHPSQLYEALKNLFIFFILLFLSRKPKFRECKGLLFSFFLILYSSLRFFLSFFRDEPALFFNLTLNHYLCILTFVLGTFLFIKTYKKCFLHKHVGI